MAEKMFTEDEAMHLVAREVAKQRMSDMERKISDNDTKTSIALAEIKTQIKQVINMIEKQSIEEDHTRKELKEEIERDFATKSDLKVVEVKLDGLVTKIAMVVGTLTAIGLVIKWIMEVAQATGKI
jgi:septal ring factor EnvC (AmiA/AmiB activator)